MAKGVGGAISRDAADEKAIRGTIEELVSCGTRHSLSSWEDPKRGVGCGRNKIVARLNQIAKASKGRMQIVVDRFEASRPRTNDKPARFENVMGILPGSDPTLAKTVFLVSGHFDSMPSSVMDPAPTRPAPMTTPRASRSRSSARACSPAAPTGPRAVSGEEQGLIGGKRLLAYVKEKGYTIGGFLNNNIVGADFSPGGTHRVRVFSGGGPDGVDSPSRDLARAVEEIAGRDKVRMVFRLDRLGRGGDHRPFVEAGLASVRFTEPLENYDHEHQTPRIEEGREYGDQIKFLNFGFIGTVARANAECLRQLAQAPAVPADVTISGGVTPDAKVAWSAPDDPDRAGFEVLWRETTEPRWSVFDVYPSPGEQVLKGVSTDNHFFGVRSVDKNGARSIPVGAVLKPPPPKK